MWSVPAGVRRLRSLMVSGKVAAHLVAATIAVCPTSLFGQVQLSASASFPGTWRDAYDGVGSGTGLEVNAAYRPQGIWYVALGARRAQHGVAVGSVRFTSVYLAARMYDAERKILVLGGVHPFVGVRVGYLRAEGVSGAPQPVREGLETTLAVGWNVKLTPLVAVEWLVPAMLQFTDGGLGGQWGLRIGLAIGSW